MKAPISESTSLRLTLEIGEVLLQLADSFVSVPLLILQLTQLDDVTVALFVGLVQLHLQLVYFRQVQFLFQVLKSQLSLSTFSSFLVGGRFTAYTT